MGHISCSMVFRFRNIRMRVNFDGGSITSQGIVPAVYKTSDYLIQHVIESSDKFKKGFIQIQETIDLGEDPDYVSDKKPEEDLDLTPSSVNDKKEEEEKKEEEGKEESTKEYLEVTNLQSARSIMVNEYKVPLSEIQTKELLLKKAKEIGVSFPNMK